VVGRHITLKTGWQESPSEAGVVACLLIIPPECRNLNAAQSQATMAEVQERLGRPLARTHTPPGRPGFTKFVRSSRRIVVRRPDSGTTSTGWCLTRAARYAIGPIDRSSIKGNTVGALSGGIRTTGVVTRT